MSQGEAPHSLRTCECGDSASDAAWPHVADAVIEAHLSIRMLSGVLRGESPAVDARPALSTSDSIVWTDRALMRPDQVCAASRYGGYSGATLRHPVGARPGRPLTCGNEGRTGRCAP